MLEILGNLFSGIYRTLAEFASHFDIYVPQRKVAGVELKLLERNSGETFTYYLRDSAMENPVRLINLELLVNLILRWCYRM